MLLESMNSTLIKSLFFIPLMLLETVITTLPLDPPSSPDRDTFVVVLDAGHGGRDPGNLGNGFIEKNIALKIVLATGAVLEKQADVKVVYTRRDDTFVDLFRRGEIANKANADIFVSVHCDAFKSADPHGATTFVLGLHANEQNFEIAKKENSVIYLEDDYQTRYSEYDINSPESVIGLTIMQEEFLEKSILLARKMQQNFARNLKRNNRKVKQAGFIVLHQTFMPSVLVETGFLTNRMEGAYLNSKAGQAEMGEAIAEAIMAYKAEVEQNTAVSIEPDIAAAPETTPEIENVTEQPKEQIVQKNTDAASELPKNEEVDPSVSAIEKELNTPAEVNIKQEEASDSVEKDQLEEEDAAAEAEIKTAELPAIEKVEEEVKPEKTKPEAEETTPESPRVITYNASSIEYRVQIMASAKKLDLVSQNFKGLNNLTREPYKNLYRYMYGQTSSYDQVKLFKANADAKGYTTSYIVAYKDGIRIAVNEALAYQKSE